MSCRAYVGATATAVVAAGVLIATFKSWSPEAWAALAAWITAAVAVAAGYMALGQLGETRAARLEQTRLRKEQAQPYVVAFLEFSEASSFFVDLVVRNFGATAAHDISLDIDPAPRRSIDADRQGEAAAERDETVWLPERIPVLVPGQEWRTLWDSGKRLESDLPDHHAANMSYRDSQGEFYSVETVLDWRVVKERDVVQIYGAHHAAKALQELSKTITKWKEGPGGGLAVYVRDGDAKDERVRQTRDARLAQQRSRATAVEAPPYEQ